MVERRAPRVEPPAAAVPAKKRRSGRGTKSAKPAPSEKPSGESNEPTIAALEARRRETLQLVIAGVPLSAIADKYGLDISTISRDYRRAMANYYGPTQDEAASFRAEITERQRTLIMSNFAAAKAGDPKAAGTIQRADSILADIWGLRSMKIDAKVEAVSRDDIERELAAFLAGHDDGRAGDVRPASGSDPRTAGR